MRTLKKLTMLAAVLMAAAAPSYAQGAYPTAEIFGGYSYLNIEGSDELNVDRQGLHGFGVSAAGNLTRHFGIVADFSYNLKNNIEVGAFDVDVRAFYYLFGPRFSARTDTATVFGHVLVGGVRARTDVFLRGSTFAEETDNDLALGVGGGVDLNANRSIAIRVFQVDYLPTRTTDVFGDKKWTNNFRAQAGIVIKFGGD
jgi:opacity protein-like surface antigen